MNQEINYFVRGYTGKGRVNLIETNVDELKDIYILKAANEKTATLFFTEIIKLLGTHKRQETVEILHHPDYDGAIDGIILRDQSVAMLTTPYMKYISSSSHLIDLTKYTKLDVEFVDKNKHEIIEKATEYLAESLRYHNELEKIYIEAMDYSVADEMIAEFIKTEINGHPSLNKQGKVYERLFGSNAAYGVVDTVDTLIEPISSRYFIKGETGTGKSYFLKEVKEVVLNKGYDVEVYRCSFNPDSIDMLIIRELDSCLFDSTGPHNYDPSRPGDKVLNFYEVASNKKLLEEKAKEIKTLRKDYQKIFNKGMDRLSLLKTYAGNIDHMEIDLNEEVAIQILKDYRLLAKYK